MKVETLSEKDINAIGHAFGYYEYAQGEKGLVSAYSSKDAVVSYINGYVEMVLQAGMLYTTGPQQEAFIAYKRCDEKVGLKAGQKLIKGMFAGSSFGEVVRMLSILGSGGSSSIETEKEKTKIPVCRIGMCTGRIPGARLYEESAGACVCRGQQTGTPGRTGYRCQTEK